MIVSPVALPSPFGAPLDSMKQKSIWTFGKASSASTRAVAACAHDDALELLNLARPRRWMAVNLPQLRAGVDGPRGAHRAQGGGAGAVRTCAASAAAGCLA